MDATLAALDPTNALECGTSYLDLRGLDESCSAAARTWALDDWIPMGRTTLLLGENDPYKSIFLQQLATGLTGTRHFVSEVSVPRKVLAWMYEDPIELRSRQLSISKRLEIPFGSLAGKLFLGATGALDCTLTAKCEGTMRRTALLTRLREEIGDLGIDVFVVENVARTFAGNEHERYDIAAYLAALRWAANPTKAAIIISDDPPKSRYKSSVSLETAVVDRLWFSDRMPCAPESGGATADLRHIYKRESNYASDDVCVLCFDSGAFTVVVEPGSSVVPNDSSRRERFERCKRVVLDALRHFQCMGQTPVVGKSSPSYFLPKLILESHMAQGFSKAELTEAMLTLVNLDRVLKVVKGKHASGGAREGILVFADPPPHVSNAQVHTLSNARARGTGA